MEESDYTKAANIKAEAANIKAEAMQYSAKLDLLGAAIPLAVILGVSLFLT